MPAAACSASHESPSAAVAQSHDAYVRGEVSRMVSESVRFRQLKPGELCKVRFLYYRGDENYGLGNVLYDVSSAAALAVILNRTLIYGADADDR